MIAFVQRKNDKELVFRIPMGHSLKHLEVTTYDNGRFLSTIKQYPIADNVLSESTEIEFDDLVFMLLDKAAQYMDKCGPEIPHLHEFGLDITRNTQVSI